MSRDDAPLSDADLDEIEAELREGVSKGGGEEWYANVALPLVAEVRRLRAEPVFLRAAELVEQRAGREEGVGGAFEARKVAAWLRSRAEPAPLDTGREPSQAKVQEFATDLAHNGDLGCTGDQGWHDLDAAELTRLLNRHGLRIVDAFGHLSPPAAIVDTGRWEQRDGAHLWFLPDAALVAALGDDKVTVSDRYAENQITARSKDVVALAAIIRNEEKDA